MTLRIQLLGGFKITDSAEVSIEIHQPRLQMLVAYLIFHHETAQLRSHLSYLFWPDSSEKQARTNLRKLLHTLRVTFPAAAEHIHLTTETARWRMTPDCWCDAVAFENGLAAAERNPGAQVAHLAAAVAHYGGALLPGRYDDWVLVARERLHLQYVQALAQLAEAYADQGNLESAIGAAQQLIQADSVQESAHRLLMRLYLEMGELAAALRVYHVCAGILEEELGVEPSRETHDLYLKILSAEDRNRSDDPPAVNDASTTTRPSSTYRRALPLTGRREEWQQLRRVWQEAQRAGPRLAVLQGEAGIGKTRLAEELADTARKQGHAVLQARAYAAEGRIAYGPLSDLLRNEVAMRALATLPTVWQEELTRIVPELAGSDAAHAAPPPMTEAWQQRRFHEALVRGCLACGQPLLIHLDDFQWFDAESLGWLHFLLRFDPAAQILVVGTLRNDELDTGNGTHNGEEHGYSSLRHSLLQNGTLVEIDLSPLDETGVSHLAQELVGQDFDAVTAGALYLATEGNPLYVLETLRALDGKLPRGAVFSMTPKVQAVILGRLAQLSTSAHQVLRLAAVIGRHFTFQLLQAVSTARGDTGEPFDTTSSTAAGTPPDGIPGASVDASALIHILDELWQRRIIRAHGPHAYDFSHDRIREAVYAEISPILRAHFHLQVASALVRFHTHDLGPESGRIAQHYAAGGKNAEAAVYYRRAAQYAVERYATSEALEHLQRALDLTPPTDLSTRFELHMQFEKIQQLLGLTSKRMKNLQVMVQITEAMMKQASAEHTAPENGRLASSVVDLQRASGTLPATDPQALTPRQREALAYQAEARIRLAHCYSDAGDSRATECATFEGLRLAQLSESLPVLAKAHNCLGWVHYWRIGDMKSARRELQYAAELAHEAGMDEFEALCLENLSATGMYSGMSAAEILDHLQRAYAIFKAEGNLMSQISVTNKLGYVVFAQGEGGYAEAIAGYSSSIELCERVGAIAPKATLLSNVGTLSCALADYVIAEQMLNESLALTEPMGDLFRHALTMLFYAELCAAQGRFDEAIEYSDTSLDLLARIDSAHRRTEALSYRGYLHFLRNEPGLALPCLTEALDMARSRRDRRFEATALTRLGHVYLALDCVDEARLVYAEGFALRQDLQQFRRSLASLAGLAMAHQQLGETGAARTLADRLVEELNRPLVEYTDEVFQTIATCYKLLRTWDDARAEQVRVLACAHLEYRSRTLPTDEARHRFQTMPQHLPFYPG